MSESTRSPNSKNQNGLTRLAVLPRETSLTAGARQYGIVAALIGLVIVAQIIYPRFLSVGNINDILSQNASIGIVAVGMTFVIIAGGFDLSVGAVYALGATLYAGLAIILPVPVAGVVTAGAALVCGLANAAIITLLRVNPFIATLGTSSAILGIAYIYSNSQAFVVPGDAFAGLADTKIFGVALPVAIFVALVVCGGLILAYTVFGRNVYAVGENYDAARLSGVRVRLVTMSTYIATSLLAGFAGMIDASRLGVGQANVGASLSLDVIAVVVIGGTSLLGGEGAIWRTVVGLLTLATLTNLFYSLNVNQNWQLLAKGLILIVAVALDAALRERKR